MDTNRGTNGIRTLLVPLDGTEFSRKILDQVRTLFAPDRFQIALLHVAEPPAGLSPPYHPAAVGPDYTLYAYDLRGRAIDEGERSAHQRHALYQGDAFDEYRERLQQELERELTLFRNEGYRASATVHFGDPVSEIVSFARDEAIAAIAMATHGRTGLGRLLQGSVAQDVFASLDRPVPVLLLRPGDGDASAEERAPEREARRSTGGNGRAPGANTGPKAMLADLRGMGSLTIRRRDDGTLDEATGTFAPGDGAVDLTPLREAQRENLAVAYDGPILDPDDGQEKVRRTKVYITRIRETPTGAGEHDPEEPVWIEFAAGEVAGGDLVTERSRLET